MNALLIAALAYGIGSIPFGVLLARVFRLPDPRTIGSGNIGATNMLRTGNKKVALLTLLLDAGKGVVAVMIAQSLDMNAALALTSAALGHMTSPWLKFKGGKGVATILGGALVFSWPVGVASCCIWLLVFLFTRYVSLASVVMLSLMPLTVWLRMDFISFALMTVACTLAVHKHRGNIERLRAGTEPRMTLGRKS